MTLLFLIPYITNNWLSACAFGRPIYWCLQAYRFSLFFHGNKDWTRSSFCFFPINKTLTQLTDGWEEAACHHVREVPAWWQHWRRFPGENRGPDRPPQTASPEGLQPAPRHPGTWHSPTAAWSDTHMPAEHRRENNQSHSPCFYFISIYFLFIYFSKGFASSYEWALTISRYPLATRITLISEKDLRISSRVVVVKDKTFWEEFVATLCSTA